MVVPPHSLVGENQPLKSKFPSKEIRRGQVGGKGMFARRIGNLPQAFSCVPRIAPIMEMVSCCAEVPVLANGKVQFVDVETLVIKVQGAQELCNRLLSLTIRAVEGGEKINRRLAAVKSLTRVQQEDEIRPERSLHLPSTSRRTHNPERFYSEDCNEVQQEGKVWQLADAWRRILEMVFRSRDIEINPMGGGCISNSVLNTKGADVVNILTPQHEIFICVSQTLILRLDGRKRISARL